MREGLIVPHRKHGLKVSGKKNQLIKSIISYLDGDQVYARCTSPFDAHHLQSAAKEDAGEKAHSADKAASDVEDGE